MEWTWSRGDLERVDSPPPAIPDTGAPALPRSCPGALLSGAPLELSKGVLRDASWGMLGAKTRRRLLDLTGDTLVWWAYANRPHQDGRPTAHALGDHGYAVAEPVRNVEGGWVHRVSCYSLDPKSFRHAEVEHRPGKGAGGSATGPGHLQSAPSPPALRGISRSEQGVIGSLPPKAQRLTLDPFLGADEEVLRSESYYEGTADTLDFIVIVLAGAQTLTVASGSRYTPAGHPESLSHWKLVCRRASVTRRMGR